MLKTYTDQEIAAISSDLSSPKFNALRLRVKELQPEVIVSPWIGDTSRKEDCRGAKLEPDSQRD